MRRLISVSAVLALITLGAAGAAGSPHHATPNSPIYCCSPE